MTPDLHDYEMQVLRVCCGEDVPEYSWGAWVTECFEGLQELGLVEYRMKGGAMTYSATPSGRALVDAWNKEGAKVKFCLHGDGRYEMMIVEWPKPIPLLRRSDDQGQTWHDALR